MAVYQTYINAMNDRIKRQIAVNNPFVFKHITNLKVCYRVFFINNIVILIILVLKFKVFLRNIILIKKLIPM